MRAESINERPLSNLRLAIDLRMLRASGIGRYLRNLLPLLLPRLNAAAIRVIGDPAQFADASWAQDARLEIWPTRAPVYSLREQLLPLRGAYRNAAVCWIPHYNAPLLHRAPLVVTIHDLCPLAVTLSMPALQRAYAGLLLKRASQRADTVLCVSEFTAAEARHHLRTPPEKILVTHPGLDALWLTAAPTAHREADGRPYLLCVGNLKPHKNIELVLRAFSRLQHQIPHRLIVAGRAQGFRNADAASVQRAQAFGDRVRFTGELSDARLMELYAGATALLMPSLYEGFGLPLLEAMAMNCPVIASAAGALPEVAGDAALFFDPLHAGQLADRIRQLVRNPPLADRLRAAGHLRLQAFSLEHCAKATATALNQALEHAALGRR